MNDHFATASFLIGFALGCVFTIIYMLGIEPWLDAWRARRRALARRMLGQCPRCRRLISVYVECPYQLGRDCPVPWPVKS